jgi:uncharacterized phage infection (PIP) family protein YhgE
MHYIRTKAVEEIMLHTIRQVSFYVRNNESEFVEKVRKASAISQESAIKESKKLLAKSKRRFDEVDALIKKLYESFATGKIQEKHFAKLLSDYDGEQSALETKITELQTEIATWSEDITKTDKFIEIVRQYTEFDELTPTMVHEFIEKIIVHESDKSTGKRTQQVDVHLNFIGNFKVPLQDIPPTAKEIAEAEEAERLKQEKREQQLAKQREKNIRYRETAKKNGKYETAKAKRRARYAASRNAEIEQAIAEGKTPPLPYRPQKKYESA